MRRVIFLDIDGVLNCDGTRDRCCGYRGIESAKVAHLERLVHATGAEIVLTSTWRTEHHKGPRGGSGRLWHYLVKKLKQHGLTIVNQTPDIWWSRRGEEIIRWLANNPDVDWFVILDDEDFKWDAWGIRDYWYCTQQVGCKKMWPGLTDEDVTYIIDHMDDYKYIRSEAN